MIHIPYRIRQGIKRFFLILLALIATAAAVGIFWFTWLQRYVVYTRDNGVVLDFGLSNQFPEGEEAVPDVEETVSIYYEVPEEEVIIPVKKEEILGFYADEETLTSKMDMVMSRADLLKKGSKVMLDVKDSFGRLFYTSTVNTDQSCAVNIAQMDALIQKLKAKDIYLIARLPAFRDRHQGLTNTNDGLFSSEGAWLWIDDGRCYWMDPTKKGTLDYLIKIVEELKGLGFDEVVFDDFHFPDTDPANLQFSGDRLQAINAAAVTLMDACSSKDFYVSFMWEMEGLVLPKGHGHFYVSGVSAADAATVAQASGVTNPAINLIFLTPYHDTRFNSYSVMRPIESAEAQED